MRELIKEMLAYLCLIAMSGFWLFILVSIGLNEIVSYHNVGFYEPNWFILVSELVLCIVMLSLGIERLYRFIKHVKGGST